MEFPIMCCKCGESTFKVKVVFGHCSHIICGACAVRTCFANQPAEIICTLCPDFVPPKLPASVSRTPVPESTSTPNPHGPLSAEHLAMTDEVTETAPIPQKYVRGEWRAILSKDELRDEHAFDVANVAIHPTTREIFISDRLNHRIHVLNEIGYLQYSFGVLGSDDGQFNSPHGIVVTENNEVIVADEQNYRVQVLTTRGAHIRCFGSIGTRADQFYRPRCVALYEGLIYLTDLKYVKIFSIEGILHKAFTYPPILYLEGIAVNETGIYVSDSHANFIYKFDFSGCLLHTIGPGVDNDRMYLPHGLCLDNDGYLIVADHNKSRLQIFKPDCSIDAIICLDGFSAKSVAVFADRTLVVCHWRGHADGCVSLYLPPKTLHGGHSELGESS